MKNIWTPASALGGAALLAIAPAVMAIGIGLSATTPANASCRTDSSFVAPPMSTIIGEDYLGREVFVECGF